MLGKYCMRIIKKYLIFFALHSLILDNSHHNLYLTTPTFQASTNYDVWQASKPGYIHQMLKKKGDLWRQSGQPKVTVNTDKHSTDSRSLLPLRHQRALCQVVNCRSIKRTTEQYQQHMTLHSISPLRSCLRCNASFQLDISLYRRVFNFKSVNTVCAERENVLNPCCH